MHYIIFCLNDDWEPYEATEPWAAALKSLIIYSQLILCYICTHSMKVAKIITLVKVNRKGVPIKFKLFFLENFIKIFYIELSSRNIQV